MTKQKSVDKVNNENFLKEFMKTFMNFRALSSGPYKAKSYKY